MNQEILNIILAGLGTIVSGLCTWGIAVLTKWLDNKIKDDKLKNFLVNITAIVMDAVMAVYQEFVETLKEKGEFDEEAQKEAKEKAKQIIMGQLTIDMKNYITENFGEIQSWVEEKIEAVIYDLKNKNKAN